LKARCETDAYQAMMGRAPRRIPQWEALHNPEFEQLVTGTDPWEKPRTARLKLLERYRIDLTVVPATDTPISRPPIDSDRTRWGKGTTETWEHGRGFRSIEEVLSYDPLTHLNLLDDKSIVESRDYSFSEEEIYQDYARQHTAALEAFELPVHIAGFYNTLFMWPLLTFGWELFLELAGGYPQELKRLLADFAVINRKVFKALAKLDVEVVLCHDDICMTTGPVCSPQWLRTYIYPYYAEFFDIIHRGGKKAIFICDGNIDKVADDVVACGVDGLVGEPYTDWKTLARKHAGLVLTGEGDNQVLCKDRSEIERMVRSMVETARMAPGYFMRIGNCIPHNVPPENVKSYFDLCIELAHR